MLFSGWVVHDKCEAYMKTLTEFPGMNLKNAAKVRNDLITGGKTPDDLTQALGETLKLEGDKLTFLINALEVAGPKLQDLKRVVVFAPNEGEKSIPGGIQKGQHIYLAEYYPSLNPNPKPTHRDDPENRSRGDQRRGKPGKGRKGEGRGENRGERNQNQPAPAARIARPSPVQIQRREPQAAEGGIPIPRKPFQGLPKPLATPKVSHPAAAPAPLTATEPPAETQTEKTET